MQTIRIIIEGRVQGVYYRAMAREKAEELRITGTVRNLPEGHVEIFATGPEADLEALVSWCWSGPPRAKVTRVEVTDQPRTEFPDFSIQKS